MKKFSILALVLVLTATLFTACTGTMTDDTTGSDSTTTAPTSTTTNPTAAPTTAPTTATTSPTETTGGVNTLDPTGNGDGKDGARMPWMPGAR